ncbi:unnamed protein product, partial [Didymodactylos carnosus]
MATDDSVTSDLNSSLTGTSVGGSQSPTSVQLADIDTFTAYLKRVCAPILDSSVESQYDIDRLFSDKQSVDCIKKFISDIQCQTLLVSKTATIKDDDVVTTTSSATTSGSSSDAASNEIINQQEQQPSYVLSTEVHYINPKMISIAILKRGQ